MEENKFKAGDRVRLVGGRCAGQLGVVKSTRNHYGFIDVMIDNPRTWLVCVPEEIEPVEDEDPDK